MAILLGILSAFSFGVGDFLARFSSKEVGFKNSLFWMLVVGSIFYLILFYFFGSGLSPNSSLIKSISVPITYITALSSI